MMLGAVLLYIAHQPLEEPVSPAPLSFEEPVGEAVPGEQPGPYRLQHRELIVSVSEQADFIQQAYGDVELRTELLAFFGSLTGSEEVAAVILENAALFGIPPALAFALCWEESRYNPHAQNRSNRNKTIDRGLFQLNSDSFSKLSEEELLNPAINAYYGMSHLRWCLDTGGSEVAGLAMYNAGTNRVSAGETPKKTLDYVSRILDSRRKIEDLFGDEYERLIALREEQAEEIIPEPEFEFTVQDFRLALLSPLGRR